METMYYRFRIPLPLYFLGKKISPRETRFSVRTLDQLFLIHPMSAKSAKSVTGRFRLPVHRFYSILQLCCFLSPLEPASSDALAFSLVATIFLPFAPTFVLLAFVFADVRFRLFKPALLYHVALCQNAPTLPVASRSDLEQGRRSVTVLNKLPLKRTLLSFRPCLLASVPPAYGAALSCCLFPILPLFFRLFPPVTYSHGVNSSFPYTPSCSLLSWSAAFAATTSADCRNCPVTASRHGTVRVSSHVFSCYTSLSYVKWCVEIRLDLYVWVLLRFLVHSKRKRERRGRGREREGKRTNRQQTTIFFAKSRRPATRKSCSEYVVRCPSLPNKARFP